MSESRANLEQILELLLAEENEQAEELLHEYVVAKARQQYERVLDESEEVDEELDESEEVDESSCGSKKKHNEEEEVDETIDHSDPSADYVEDVIDLYEEMREEYYAGLEERKLLLLIFLLLILITHSYYRLLLIRYSFTILFFPFFKVVY